MPRRQRAPDFAKVFATLSPAQRATVMEWEEALGLPVGGWIAAPGLRDFLTMVAAVTLSAASDLSPSDSLAEACESLGLPDDSAYGTRPSDSLGRKLRRWVTAAHGLADIDVHARPAEKCFDASSRRRIG